MTKMDEFKDKVAKKRNLSKDSFDDTTSRDTKRDWTELPVDHVDFTTGSGCLL